MDLYQYVLTGTVLGICSVTDLRHKVVYKKVLILYGLLVLAGYGTAGKVSGETILYGIIPGVVCLLLSKFSGQALGYGDSILILFTGCSLGIQNCVGLVIWAFLCSGLWALFLVGIKRADRKMQIPFVPFLMIGFGIQILMSR